MKKEFLKRLISSLILIPLIVFLIFNGSFFLNLFLLICLLISCYEWHLMTKLKSYYFYGFIFLTFSFYSAYEINNLENNRNLFFIILLICISTDIGGYIFGNIFKGPKLTKISPNKTYSGMVGSFMLSLITIYIFSNFSYNIVEFKFSLGLLLFTLTVSAISQIGDITISYFKRKSGIKNTNNIIPGHGGLLDRIDGMIFAYPLSYLIFLTNLFKKF